MLMAVAKVRAGEPGWCAFSFDGCAFSEPGDTDSESGATYV
jgi:hypothetical protein